MATYTKKNSTTTSFPLASGTRDGCGSYFNGDRFQGSLQGDWYPSQCAFAADLYGVDLDDFYGMRCWERSCGEFHELTANKTRRRPGPELLLPEERPVLREILLG